MDDKKKPIEERISEQEEFVFPFADVFPDVDIPRRKPGEITNRRYRGHDSLQYYPQPRY